MLIRLLALLAVLGFDEKKQVEVTCPLDGTKFGAWDVKSTDWQQMWGGFDRDFCRHAFKTTPLEYFAWACPACGFAGLKADFDPKSALTDDQKKLLLGKLKPAVEIRKGMRQDAIAGHAKFDLLAQVRALLGAPPEQIGQAWLHAAWCARQQGVVYLDAYEEWIKLREEHGLEVLPMELGKKNRTELELDVARRIEKKVAERRESEKRDLETVRACDAEIARLKKEAAPDAAEIRKQEQRRGDARGRLHHLALLKYTALYLVRRHGENVEALAWIEDLGRAKGDNSVIDDAVEKTARSIERERGYQRRALEQYEKALAGGKLEKRIEAECHYLLGELHRRLGDKAKAAERYRKALELTADPNIRKFAEEQLKLVE